LGAFGVVGGVTAFAFLTKDIFEQTKQIQSLDNALKLVTGTQENFYAQQVFLNKISQDYGVNLNALTKQFTQFYVSAKDKLAGSEIQDIFESVFLIPDSNILFEKLKLLEDSKTNVLGADNPYSQRDC